MLKKLYLITFALIVITTAMNAQRGRIGDKLSDDTTKKIPPKELLPAVRPHDEFAFMVGKTTTENIIVYGANIRRDGAGVSVLAHDLGGDNRMISLFLEGYADFGNRAVSILVGVGASHYKKFGEVDNNEFAYGLGFQGALSELLVVGYSYRKAHWNIHTLKIGIIL